MKPATIVATALLAACGAAQAQDKPLTPAEIKAAWVGKKVFARSHLGGLVDLHLRADGTADVSAGNTNDAGTWRLSETGYCTTWKNHIRKGQETCFTVVRRGDRVFVINPDQSTGSEILRVVD